MLTIHGASALSAFRLDKLNRQLDRISDGVRIDSARFVHFVDVDGELVIARIRQLVDKAIERDLPILFQ